MYDGKMAQHNNFLVTNAKPMDANGEVQEEQGLKRIVRRFPIYREKKDFCQVSLYFKDKIYIH